MKAVVKYGYGPKEIEVRDVPIPEIGDDDILMEVKAAGVCGTDIAFDQGMHANLLNPPVILGHEFAGVIAAVGKNVKDWKVGDRVVSDNTGHVCGHCYACNTANYLACPERLGLGYGMDGGFTNFVKIHGDTLRIMPSSLMRIPDSMSFEAAAILDPACNGYRAVVQEGQVMPGDYVAVFGIGALGLMSIQAARAAGAAKIFAVALSSDGDTRFEIAKKCGATDLIRSDIEDTVEIIRNATGGEGVSCAVDAAGVNVVMQTILKIIRTGGIVPKIGYDARPYGDTLDPFIDGAIQLKGHFGYDWVCWRNVMNLCEAGKWDQEVVITHRMKITEWRKAFDMVRNLEATKVILYPEDL